MVHTYKRRPPPRRHHSNTGRYPIRKRSAMPPSRKSPSSRKGFHFRWRWVALLILLFFFGKYIVQLDNIVREQFEGKRWDVPARVYARPLELYAGTNITISNLIKELKTLGYRKTSNLKNPGEYKYHGRNVFIKTRVFHFWDGVEPSRTIKLNIYGNKVKSIYDFTSKNNLALFRIEPKLIGKIYPLHQEDRILLSLDEMPETLKKAVIAVEDRRFYEHWGVSLRGLLRAMLVNLRAGKWVEGGSTITQQLIKNFYLSSDRKLSRKINEAFMALLLEWHYSKEQILEAYLNEVYLGQDGKRAIHGMGMAARFYFARPLDELKLPQIALLVSLIRGASIYNPRRHSQRAVERRNLVIDIMARQDKINIVESELAKVEALDITKKPMESKFLYPAFMGLVRYQLHKDYDQKDLRSRGLQIFTTLDTTMQKKSEQVMIKGLKKLERSTRKARKLQGAMVITGSESGEVLALVNGKNPHYAGFNRPLNAVRPIGSLAKVATYLTALENSRYYDLMTTLNDTPYEWTDERTGETWKPRNYDKRLHGSVPLYKALAYSYNLASVHLGIDLGLNLVKESLIKLGVKREFNMYPSVLLGGISLSPFEVAQMYQTIASGGFGVPVRAIRDVLTHEGQPLKRYSLNIEKHFDAAPIFLLNYALQKALRTGTGKKVAKELPSSMILAGKTGTSNDLRDSWFAGFSSEVLAVTWVGRDDYKPMGLSGGSGALVIWKDFIKSVRPKAVAPIIPNNIQWRYVNGTKFPFINNRDRLANNNNDLFNF
ncbi:MAG: penicillin-binding protein 1B [Thiomargarita sp.]|nr:penicillin-binding protein 1B [Thiomargarita sp.]